MVVYLPACARDGCGGTCHDARGRDSLWGCGMDKTLDRPSHVGVVAVAGVDKTLDSAVVYRPVAARGGRRMGVSPGSLGGVVSIGGGGSPKR